FNIAKAHDDLEHADFSTLTGNIHIPVIEAPGLGVFEAHLHLVDSQQLEFILQDIKPTEMTTDTPAYFYPGRDELEIPSAVVFAADEQKHHLQVKMQLVSTTPPFKFRVIALQDDNVLEITEIEWEAEAHKLNVKGKGLKGQQVTVRDLTSDKVLGQITITEDEQWQLKVTAVDSTPCIIQAQAGEQVVRQYLNEETCYQNTLTPDIVVLAANDLGMHCADQDHQIVSILPPFNNVHAQVIQRGAEPELLNMTQVDVVYKATSNPHDPVGGDSINTGNQGTSGAKTNFWHIAEGMNTYAGLAYGPIYPGQNKLGLCDPLIEICPSVLDLFEPLAEDIGLPVPDPNALPHLVAVQQAMPGSANVVQHFKRYDEQLAFFSNFPFGSIFEDVNWFSAEGIPIVPVDDQGRLNAYPLMQVQARVKDSTQVLAAVDLVLPVSAETDCQNCHADVDDFGNGAATNFASVTTYAAGNAWDIILAAQAPGPEQLSNAARMNMLRLHDAKHGTDYRSSLDDRSIPCFDGTQASCLANQTPVQCARCHYSPALDLAQVGPVDEPEQGEQGRQQTRHISMSRAMHGHHGQFTELFPPMPPPDAPARQNDISGTLTHDLLEQTCYQCHPGKKTQCLRGAMAAGGVVCQDCHGNMTQVGNDFSGGFPQGAGADLNHRVPWVDEPQCQSCHIGDAVTIEQIDTSDFIMAADGIRLLQAYRRSDADQAQLPFIQAPTSRFAENQRLYRFSSGHGGVMCNGCHGSTHAIWPVQPSGDDPNSPFLANDNLAAIGLQGHSGTLSECTICHTPGSLELTLDGPHGMHPVNDPQWNQEHKKVAGKNKTACRA
ncbi:MAG: hypothetical protein SVR94_14590, partial [Pseudomonadota bacterium]|nr:hypothetical protein [Pseudomonadota bacterium]